MPTRSNEKYQPSTLFVMEFRAAPLAFADTADLIPGDAVVTNTLPNEGKQLQALHSSDWLDHRVIIGDWRILPHASKACNSALDPLSRR